MRRSKKGRETERERDRKIETGKKREYMRAREGRERESERKWRK